MSFPTVINNFNVYAGSDRLIGVTDEVKLPDMNAITSSVSGAGIAGTIDIPVVGAYENMDMEIPFRGLTADIFKIFKVGETVDVTLRGGYQIIDNENAGIGKSSMRVMVRGFVKSFSPGSVKINDQMTSTVTISIAYYLVDVAGNNVIELDKLNSKCVINGVDVLEDIRSYI